MKGSKFQREWTVIAHSHEVLKQAKVQVVLLHTEWFYFRGGAVTNFIYGDGEELVTGRGQKWRLTRLYFGI